MTIIDCFEVRDEKSVEYLDLHVTRPFHVMLSLYHFEILTLEAFEFDGLLSKNIESILLWNKGKISNYLKSNEKNISSFVEEQLKEPISF